MPFNGEMLKLLREQRGSTQKELAESAGVNQTMLSKYEKGEKVPSKETWIKLAETFGYPQAFFELPSVDIANGLIFHRKRASLSAGDRTFIEADAKLRMLVAQNAFGLAGTKTDLPDFNILGLEDLTDKEIAGVAAEFRAKLNIQDGPIDNLVKVLEDCNVVIVEFPFRNEMLDGFFIRSEESVFIALNKNMPADRKRFTLAHELGHILLHKIPYENAENEANKFASEFLMPKKDIASDFKTLISDKIDLRAFLRLKSKWRVSIQALIRRARDTGFIDDDVYKRLCIYMSAAGYRKTEPAPLQDEEPRLLRDTLYSLKAKFGGMDALAEKLRISSSILNKMMN